jgi:hypothetical protein
MGEYHKLSPAKRFANHCALDPHHSQCNRYIDATNVQYN